MSKGIVYILINAVQSEYVKIGKTSRTAQERADELNRQGKTSLAGKHVVAYYEEVENCDLVERLLHEKLKKYRTPEKEFFHIPLREAILTIGSVLKELEKQKRIGITTYYPPQATTPSSWWRNLTQVWKQIFKNHLALSYEPTESELIEGVSNIIYYSRNVELRSLIAKLIMDKDYQKKILNWYKKLDVKNQKLIKSYLERDISEMELTEIIALKNVNCCDNLFVKDLIPITYLQNIETLNCRNTSIRDVEIVKNFLTLREINLNLTEVQSIEPLINLPNLKKLSCDSSKVSKTQIELFEKQKPDCEVEKSHFGDFEIVPKLKRNKKL